MLLLNLCPAASRALSGVRTLVLNFQQGTLLNLVIQNALDFKEEDEKQAEMLNVGLFANWKEAERKGSGGRVCTRVEQKFPRVRSSVSG